MPPRMRETFARRYTVTKEVLCAEASGREAWEKLWGGAAEGRAAWEALRGTYPHRPGVWPEPAWWYEEGVPASLRESFGADHGSLERNRVAWLRHSGRLVPAESAAAAAGVGWWRGLSDG